MSSDYARLLAAFGLTEYKTSLLHTFHVTDAFIGGSAALTWHIGNEFLPDQDLDIFYTPSPAAPRGITVTLFDTLFSAAGYKCHSLSTGDVHYTDQWTRYIAIVHNWFHTTLKRKIQLVIRSERAPTDSPAYTETDFDICQFYAKYDPRAQDLILRYNPATITPEIAEEIRTKRVMRIGNLTACQSLLTNLKRLRKYYARGFAFEDERETLCSCACGHEHTTKKYRRLTLDEAYVHVATEYRKANLRVDPNFLVGALLCDDDTFRRVILDVYRTEYDQFDPKRTYACGRH